MQAAHYDLLLTLWGHFRGSTFKTALLVYLMQTSCR